MSTVRLVAIAGLAALAALSYAKSMQNRDYNSVVGANFLTGLSILLATKDGIKSNSLRLTSQIHGAPFRRVSFAVLFFVLWAIRRGRKFRRWLFRGRNPVWVDDIVSLVSYFNFVGLIPTFAIMAASPEHLFSRMPPNGKAYNGLYKAPLKFLASFAALLAVVTIPLAKYASQFAYTRYLVIALSLISPILIVAFCLATRLLYIYLNPVPFRNAWKYANLVSDDIVTEIISVRTYRKLDWTIYCWSALYFYVYSYGALALACAMAVATAAVFLDPGYAVPAFVICANRWIVYRYYILLHASFRDADSGDSVRVLRMHSNHAEQGCEAH